VAFTHPMSDIDKVVDRITRDPDFADQLARDPRAALAGYELTTAELRHLADRLAARPDRSRRRDHSALRALLTGDDP
jgi:hypothetical protein